MSAPQFPGFGFQPNPALPAPPAQAPQGPPPGFAPQGAPLAPPSPFQPQAAPQQPSAAPMAPQGFPPGAPMMQMPAPQPPPWGQHPQGPAPGGYGPGYPAPAPQQPYQPPMGGGQNFGPRPNLNFEGRNASGSKHPPLPKGNHIVEIDRTGRSQRGGWFIVEVVCLATDNPETVIDASGRTNGGAKVGNKYAIALSVGTQEDFDATAPICIRIAITAMGCTDQSQFPQWVDLVNSCMDDKQPVNAYFPPNPLKGRRIGAQVYEATVTPKRGKNAGKQVTVLKHNYAVVPQAA